MLIKDKTTKMDRKQFFEKYWVRRRLSILNADTLGHVMSYLPIDGVVSMLRVSKEWNRYFTILWSKKDKTKFPLYGRKVISFRRVVRDNVTISGYSIDDVIILNNSFLDDIGLDGPSGKVGFVSDPIIHHSPTLKPVMKQKVYQSSNKNMPISKRKFNSGR